MPLPVKLIALGLLAGGLCLAGVLIHYTGRFNRLIDAKLMLNTPLRTAVYARPGLAAGGKPEFLSSLHGAHREKRRHLPLTEFPDRLIEALLSAEDKRFYEHIGVDWRTLARALLSNVLERNLRQGGSTLTQQFVKNYFLSQEKTLLRKFQEMYFAVLLERKLSKTRILELYANDVYLGQVGSFAIRGFGQGALIYFGKEVKDLTLSEMAVLAGIIQAPNRHSPYRHPEGVLTRRDYVLDRMETNGFISTRENAEARAQPLTVRPVTSQDAIQAPYFVDYLAGVLERDYGLFPGSRMEHLEIYSTLDRKLQAFAYEAVQEHLLALDQKVAGRRHPPNIQVSLVAVEPSSGEIVALIGGRSYSASQFNRATHAFRQPGSTFKPFVLASALGDQEGHLTLSTRLMDEPYTFQFDNQQYSPGNHSGSYLGPVTLRQTLANSLNVPTVKLAEQIGFDRVAQTSHWLGFDGVRAYPSAALGTFEVSPLQLAQAYQALASGGIFTPLTPIRRVVLDGRQQQPAEDRPSRRVLDSDVAYLVTSAMQSVLDEGTATAVRRMGFTIPAAGKTGSTDDAWFAGFTRELLCIVWVGTDTRPALNLSGSQAALPIWTRFMKKAHQAGYLQGDEFLVPRGISRIEIDNDTGLQASGHCQNLRVEYYLRGTEPAICRGQDVAIASDERRPRKKGGIRGWFSKIFRR